MTDVALAAFVQELEPDTCVLTTSITLWTPLATRRSRSFQAECKQSSGLVGWPEGPSTSR